MKVLEDVRREFDHGCVQHFELFLHLQMVLSVIRAICVCSLSPTSGWALLSRGD